MLKVNPGVRDTWKTITGELHHEVRTLKNSAFRLPFCLEEGQEKKW
jgi:hypothetical protein